MKPTSIFLLLLIFAACTKEQTVTLKAVDAATELPVVNFEYYILSSHKVKGEIISETVAYGKTDFQGNGIVNLKMKKGRNYTLHGVQAENVCYLNSTEYSIPKKDKNSSFQFEIASCGTLKLDIDNIGCTGENDQMTYRIKPSFGGWKSWSEVYSGCYSGSPQNISVPAGPLKIQWNVIKTGYSYTDSAEITIDRYEPTAFHLQY